MPISELRGEVPAGEVTIGTPTNWADTICPGSMFEHTLSGAVVALQETSAQFTGNSHSVLVTTLPGIADLSGGCNAIHAGMPTKNATTTPASAIRSDVFKVFMNLLFIETGGPVNVGKGDKTCGGEPVARGIS